MSKRSQLQRIREAGLPTPPFITLTWEAFQSSGCPRTAHLQYPLAVRSSWAEEDSATQAHAGQYHTELWVSANALDEAIARVFAAYPRREGSEVILQEMLDPSWSGVLFAYREAAWKMELTPGQGAGLVGGQVDPKVLLLPRFSAWDAYWASWFSFWKPGLPLDRSTIRALVRLSVLVDRLFAVFPESDGLDIEWAICDGRPFLLQARPITTPWEAEEVLTAANHREILPPDPSPLMTSIIGAAGYDLFGYYRELDPQLGKRSFIHLNRGMPWINLTALLDAMVAWGLPTALVCRSVGAEDVYRVRLRPWRVCSRLPVFFKLLRKQIGITFRVRDWVKRQRGQQHWERSERELLWEMAPKEALDQWLAGFSAFYVQLVTHMQDLTAAMSGPLQILDRLGILSKQAVTLHDKSSSTDYLHAFQQLQEGQITREVFLRRFGHRGFYESDIGRPRFFEYSEADWAVLLRGAASGKSRSNPSSRVSGSGLRFLIQPVMRVIHMREWVRHVSMYFFGHFRREINTQCQTRYGDQFDFSAYTPTELHHIFENYAPGTVPPPPSGSEQSGWDVNTFLGNQKGRRLPLSLLSTAGASGDRAKTGIGIYPGIVEGTVWRVREATLQTLQPPQAEVVILVADALDPGWVPYFSRVDGVVAYVGGLLSHASIMLREAGIPAVTQIPETLELRSGDRIRMNGQSGEVLLLSTAAAIK